MKKLMKIIKQVSMNLHIIKLQRNTPTRKINESNLAVRADVMNKNILRAVKRECKNMYQNYVSANSLPTSRDFIDQNVNGFVRHLCESTHIEGCLFDKFKQLDLCVYLKILLNYCQMKKEIYSATDKLKMNTTYDVLYSYTHKKFHQFIAIPEIGVLIRMIIDMQGLSEFVSKISNKNHQKYEKHLNEICEDILRYSNASS